jgi:hypothetical protein
MKKFFLSSTYHLDGVLVGTGLSQAQKLALIFSGSKIFDPEKMVFYLHSFFLHLFLFNRELSATKQGVCHTVALPFTLKSILRQKKNYGNSNISLCKNIISKKSSTRNQNPSRYHNSLTNLKFQNKPKYHL